MSRFLLTILLIPLLSFADDEIIISALVNDPNGIAEDQTTVGAGNLTINGALATGGVATIGTGFGQTVAIESAANLSAITFTVTGTDPDGFALSEDITGPNATTVYSTLYFSTVTQIAVDGAVGSNVEVGTNGPANGFAITKSIPLQTMEASFAATLAADITTGTGTFGFQYTTDKTGSARFTNGSLANDATWYDAVDSSGSGLDPDTNMADGTVNVYSPVRYARGKITADSSGGYVFTVIQGTN